MHTDLIVKPGVSLAGIAVRTTNAVETGGDGRLSALWNDYFASGVAERLQAKHAHLIYALYTDYESDATGAYTVLIGHERGDVPVPSGLAQAEIPESKFLVFKTKKGPVYEVVAQAWQEIWAFFEQSSIERAYTGDYELYDGRSFDPAATEVDIYIAVK